jgi:hypothetical protein
MKIASQTADEMVVKDSGIFNAVFSVGMMFFGVGGICMMALGGASPFIILIPIIMFLLGLLWFLTGPSTIVDIKKPTGQIIYQKKKKIGGTIATYSITDATRIEMRSRATPKLISQSFLILHDGKELSLNLANETTAKDQYQADTGKRIADFLGVPFQEVLQ